MKHFFLLNLLFALVLNGFAQDNEYSIECRDACTRAQGMSNARINYFQSPSMNKYDVKYLKLDINAELSSRAISGNTFYIAKAVQPIDTFIIEFRGTMILDSAFVNGTKMSFLRANDHIFIPLAVPLAPGTLFNTQFYHRGTASSLAIYTGTVTSSGLSYTASLSESYQAREWYPAKQLLADKMDSVDVWITTSPTNMAGANGLLKSVVTLPNGKKQFKWSSRYPINYYLPSFSVGNYQEYLNYAKPPAIAPDSILIQHYISNSTTYLNSVRGNLDKTANFIEKFSQLVTTYPFWKEKYGHCHANIGGGMEHQTMSTMSSFGLTLIAHELFHQWFGDNVTCATWNDIWLNEGFATYGEYLMIQNFPTFFPTTTDSAYMQSVHNSVMSVANGSVYIPDASIYDENRIFSSRLSYNKGAAIIHNLRFEMQNDNLFFQTLKNYQQQYKDSVATATQFKAIAEAVSGKNFTDFFNQWYYGEGYPTYNVDYYMQGDSLVLTVWQTASAPTVTPLFKGLMEFQITSLQGDTTLKAYITANGQQFKFKYTRVPNGVVVDPKNWVINRVGSITTDVAAPQNLSSQVRVYPNPVKGPFTLSYPSSFKTLTIFTIDGKQMDQINLPAGTSSCVINKPYAPGIYLLQLQGKTTTAVKKVIFR